MTSQLLAIFYLNDFDHFVKEKLKIKYYIRYQDDGLIFHESKEYLKYCLNEIIKFLKSEKLEFNSKTRIYTNKCNFIFLGRDRFGRYSRYRTMKRKLKKRVFLYNIGEIDLNSLSSSIQIFRTLSIKM